MLVESINRFQLIWLRFMIKLPLYHKYSTKNPKWLLMFLLCRFQIIRSFVTFFSQPPLLNEYKRNESLFNAVDVENAVKTMNKDGCFLGIKLPKNVRQEIMTYASYATCYANGDSQLSFNIMEKENCQAKYEKNFVIGEYLNVSNGCSAINKLTNDSKLLEIAASYLKAEPICTGIRLWWSFAGKATLHERIDFAQELFHYDPVDYGAIKFFFYLTDVDFSSGPHVYVRGSHKKKKLSQQLSLFIGRSDKDITDYYKAEEIVYICEEAGFGFAEDPFCFHKGTPPSHENRLMLQIQFSLNDYRI